MRFEPKTEKQIAEAMLLPEGEYDFVVIKAEDKVSQKKGTPMIKVTLGIYQNDGTQRIINDYLMESFPRKLRRFAEVIGLLAQYEMGELNAEECEGRAGKCTLIIKKQIEFPDKNEVKDYVVNRGEAFKPMDLSISNPPAPATAEDDIPF